MTATAPVRTTRWSVETVTDGAALWTLEAEWEDLYARSIGATPFQRHAWIHSWWAEYGTAGKLLVVLVRRDDRLVAAAPLRLLRRGPVRVLASLGGDQSDYHDVLLDTDCASEAAEKLAHALLRLPGWDVLDLAEVRAGAGANRLADAWPGARRWRGHGALCQELRFGSVPDFVANLPKHTAKTVKRKLRKIDAAPITSRQVPAADVPAAIGDLLALHAGQWAGRSVSAEHLRPRFRRHLTGALTRMVEKDQAVITEYRCQDKVVVVDLELAGPDFMGTYLAGFDPALREYVDIAVLMLTRAFGEVERRGMPGLSLLRGDEPYKSHWYPTAVRNERIFLGRTATALGYARATLLRGRLAETVKERYPKLREARVTARSQLGRLRRP